MGSPELIARNRETEMRKCGNYGNVLTTPESIVREFRIADRGIRIESVKEPISKLERAIQIFLIFTFGWMIGYFHHFLSQMG